MRLYKLLMICGLIGFGLFLLTLTPAPAVATEANLVQQATPTANPNLSIGNDACLECHGKPGLSMKLDNGDELSLTVDPQMYDGSVHGKGGYACVQCHTTVGNYPHPPFTAADRRDASLKLYPACYRCHSGEYEKTQDSVHAAALAAGKREAAICTDCHTAHAVRQLSDPKTGQPLPGTRTWIAQTCAQCHNAIYQEYLTSVHGSALVGDGNPDVPTCIDCHGVHNIGNPLTNAFRLNSPELCAKCHTDPKRMTKYGISTQVLNTYVADFHGTTVNIFQNESPDAPTNKPVCFDCHGVHNITRVDDPQKGLLVEQNLLARCKVCHPDATANFPTAWLSHYVPSAKHNSIVYYVGLFYKLLIPTVLGGMALLVVMDFGRSWLNRYQRAQKPVSMPLEEVESPSEEVSLQAESPEPHPMTEPPPSLPEAIPIPETPPSPQEAIPTPERPPSPTEVMPTEQTPPVIEAPQVIEAAQVIESSADEAQATDDAQDSDEIHAVDLPDPDQVEPKSPDQTPTPPPSSDEEATHD